MVEIRNHTILQLLQTHTVMTVEELCERLIVSPATVRRCLTELEQQQSIRRISGGVMLAPSQLQVNNIPFLEQKKLIAKAAAALIKPGDTVFIDAGTTNYEIAQLLGDISDIIVVTNCLKISYQLFMKKNITLFVCGGSFDPTKPESGMIGEPAEKLISKFRANIAFICSSGVHIKYGVMEHFQQSAKIKQTMIEYSSNSVLVCDHSKFGRLQSSFVSRWADFCHLITDRDAPQDDLDYLRNTGLIVTKV